MLGGSSSSSSDERRGGAPQQLALSAQLLRCVGAQPALTKPLVRPSRARASVPACHACVHVLGESLTKHGIVIIGVSLAWLAGRLVGVPRGVSSGARRHS
jgi:hypothetical protein